MATKTTKTVKANKSAEEAEATDSPITIEFEGMTFELPLREDLDVEVLEAIEQGKSITTVKLFMGQEQWNKLAQHFRSSGAKFTARDLKPFAELAAAAMGFSGRS